LLTRYSNYTFFLQSVGFTCRPQLKGKTASLFLDKEQTRQNKRTLKVKIHKPRDRENQRQNLQASNKKYNKGVRKIPHSE
jgi:hypothetical protein